MHSLGLHRNRASSEPATHRAEFADFAKPLQQLRRPLLLLPSVCTERLARAVLCLRRARRRCPRQHGFLRCMHSATSVTRERPLNRKDRYDRQCGTEGVVLTKRLILERLNENAVFTALEASPSNPRRAEQRECPGEQTYLRSRLLAALLHRVRVVVAAVRLSAPCFGLRVDFLQGGALLLRRLNIRRVLSLALQSVRLLLRKPLLQQTALLLALALQAFVREGGLAAETVKEKSRTRRGGVRCL